MIDRHPNHQPAGDRLRSAFVLTLVILVVEAIAGWRANSLALISDAGHVLTDAFALGVAWYAARLSGRHPDERNTFGYRRGSILAALANAILLVLIGLAVAAEAVLRLQHPQHVVGGIVVLAALGAIAINSYIALRLRIHGHENLNVRAALLHVVGDIAASVGALIAGAVILVWHAYLLDPMVSVLIALLIGYGAWQIVRQATVILMESTPPGVDLAELTEAMRQVPGVDDVHDLHVWALSDGFRLLTAHVSVPDQSLADATNLLDNLKMLLRTRFQIQHATIEFECMDCRIPQRRPIQLHQRDTG